MKITLSKERPEPNDFFAQINALYGIEDIECKKEKPQVRGYSLWFVGENEAITDSEEFAQINSKNTRTKVRYVPKPKR